MRTAEQNLEMLTKQIENDLITNPKYSSTWISVAAKLMAEFCLSEDILVDLNTEQLEIIYDLEKYISTHPDYHILDIVEREYFSKYNATQLRLILTAYMKEVPAEIITKFIAPEIPYAKSNYLIQAYIDGYDMSSYIDFDHEQIYELYAGYVNNVDTSKYDKIDISAEKMGIIRHALELKMDPIYDEETKTITIQ